MAAERKRARPRHLPGSPSRQYSNAHTKPPLVLERAGRQFHPGIANRATRPSCTNVRVQGARDGLVTAEMRALWQVLDVEQHLRDVVVRASTVFMRHRREQDKGVKAMLYPFADGVRRSDSIGNRYASQQFTSSISVHQVTNGCFRVGYFASSATKMGAKLPILLGLLLGFGTLKCALAFAQSSSLDLSKAASGRSAVLDNEVYQSPRNRDLVHHRLTIQQRDHR